MKFQNLNDTATMMASADYKERFKAEYYQLQTRTEKLQKMCDDWDNNKLNFTPTCPRSTYDLQLKFMTGYLAVLEMRAKIEGIQL